MDEERDRRLEKMLYGLKDCKLPVIGVEYAEDIRSLLADYRAAQESDKESLELYRRCRERAERAEARVKEALRAERDLTRSTLLEEMRLHSRTVRERDEARAERDRLREAVRQIVEIGTRLIEHDPPLNHEIATACGEMDRHARRALASGEESHEEPGR